MRVLLATPDVSSAAGGPGYSVPAIARCLHNAGHRVGLVAMRGLSDVSAHLVATPSDVLSAEVVHNFGAWTAFNHFVALGALVRNKPLVYAPIGMLEPWALKQKPFKKRLGLWLYQRQDLRRAAVLHATAREEAEHLRELAPSTPIAVIAHGVDMPESPRTFLSENQRAVRTVLFMSRIHPKKGLLELIRAWALVQPVGWRLIIAGPDEEGHRSEVEAEIARLRIGSQVCFVGPVQGQAKQAVFQQAELFVLPTFSENFGIAVAEALAHGLPVITTRGAPWREVEETGCGWWIDTGVDALAATLRDALECSRYDLAAMGQRGVQLIQERYSWSARATKYSELYTWLSGGPRPSFVWE